MEAPQISVLGVDGLRGLVGADLPATRWIAISRQLHTGHDESSHYEPTRYYLGAADSPIAHGAHTLSLAVPLFEQTVLVDGFAAAALYGFDRVRFPTSVPIGGRVRAHFRVLDVTPSQDAVLCRIGLTVELEGAAKPACVADLLLSFRY